MKVLPVELAGFYERLLASEARHFKQYLRLAEHYAAGPLDDRLDIILKLDAELISAPDTDFRFHSGPLVS